jgi:hypothetical protein
MPILAPISAGELIDKITILRVKAERIGDAAKEANVRKELALLEATAGEHLPASAQIDRLTAELTAVNAALWDIEDGKRDCERRQDFGPDFVALARRVYISRPLPLYRPLKAATRFCKKALTPSMKSSVLPAIF